MSALSETVTGSNPPKDQKSTDQIIGKSRNNLEDEQLCCFGFQNVNARPDVKDFTEASKRFLKERNDGTF